MLAVLLSLLLAVHLLCVNVAAGGPIVAAWLDWRGSRGDEAAGRAAKTLAGWSLAGLLIGAVLGLAMGWLKWDANYRDLWLGPLSYKLHWAAIEWIFSLLLMIGWWLWLPGRARGNLTAPLSPRGRGVGGEGGIAAKPRSMVATLFRGLVAALASTNLLYHFPLLFSVASRLHDARQTAGPRIGPAAFRQLMAVGETPAMAVHVSLASIAVAGIMLLGLALRWQRQGETAAAAKAAAWGGRWALFPTLAQLPVGLWTLTMLTPSVQTRLMGGDAIGTVLFLASLAAAFWLVRELVGVAWGETAREALIRSMAAMLATVVLMTAMQQQVRGGAGFQPAISAEELDQ